MNEARGDGDFHERGMIIKRFQVRRAGGSAMEGGKLAIEPPVGREAKGDSKPP